MKRIVLPKARMAAAAPRVPDRALAAFLDDLARVYRSKETGNLPLANSLHLLAKSVRRRSLQPLEDGEAGSVTGEKAIKGAGRPKSSNPAPRPLDAEVLAKLSQEQVLAFLRDQTKSKNELLDLAAARFSIPVSQLKRLKAEEVRDTIEAALHHEHSIDILSVESRKDGASRSS